MTFHFKNKIKQLVSSFGVNRYCTKSCQQWTL